MRLLVDNQLPIARQAEVSGQKSEVEGQKSEVRNQKSEIGGLTPDFRHPTSDLCSEALEGRRGKVPPMWDGEAAARIVGVLEDRRWEIVDGR